MRVRDLQVGERLQTAEGAVGVEALEKVRGEYRVFNLEVERAHEYLVGEAGVRAHNTSPCGSGGVGGAPEPVRAFAHGTSLDNIDNIVANGLRADAARAATRGGALNRPGSFFVFSSRQADFLQESFNFGLRHAQQPAVLVT